MVATLMSCKDENNANDNMEEGSILGRWVLEGFEDNIRYDFTEDKRFTIYGVDGVFPTLEEFQEENPGLTGHDWYYDGEVVVVDLNFGNFSRTIPSFHCGNEVLHLTQEDESFHGVYFREGHDLSECSE